MPAPAVSRVDPHDVGMSGGRGVAVGVVAVLAALGCGQLAAGLMSSASSPFLAVADTVVRFSPAGLTEFGKSLQYPALGLGKGVADKDTLLFVIAVVLLGVAAAAGLLSRRRATPGLWVIGVLGVLGLAAVIFSPVFSPLGLAAPLVSLSVGLGAFAGLHGLARRRAGPISVHAIGAVSRRRFLLSSAALGVVSVAAGLGGALLGAGSVPRSRQALFGRLRPSRPAPPIPAGADFASLGTPTFVTDNKDFYRIDTALQIPAQAAEEWSMRIHGMVDNETTLTYRDLLRRPLLEKTITMTCVSNEVGGALISTSNFTGVSLRDLLIEAGLRPGAEQIYSTSLDGWTAGTPTEVVMHPDSDALLAIAMNGEPLPAQHGFPVRMVVPGLYGFVSATKWLTDLELTTFAAKQSYWMQRGWAQRAPIKTQSRIDRPTGFQTLTRGPSGAVSAAGIAWAQQRGIDKVEVQVDNTAWQPAELTPAVNLQTWRMWRANLTLAPGDHFIQCRATDSTGATQTEQRTDPIPNGATGWPGISFTVA